jgi:hypothetical protein
MGVVMKNVLFSLDKLELMKESIRTCKELGLVQDILITMPDFVESEEDAVFLTAKIDDVICAAHSTKQDVAQAAINALRGK